jgi:hypothetical protein
MEELIPIEIIETKIYVIRGQRVMLDKDLSALYQVKPIALRQQVKRNSDRFPIDFMFQLNDGEVDVLLSQKVIPSKKVLGGSLPLVFTEQGVAMLSSVLSSKRAIMVNIQIMRTFTKIKKVITTSNEMKLKLELVIKTLKEHDAQIGTIYSILDQLLEPPPEEDKRQIGFIRTENPKSQYVPKSNKISNHKSQKGIKDGN